MTSLTNSSFYALHKGAFGRCFLSPRAFFLDEDEVLTSIKEDVQLPNIDRSQALFLPYDTSGRISKECVAVTTSEVVPLPTEPALLKETEQRSIFCVHRYTLGSLFLSRTALFKENIVDDFSWFPKKTADQCFFVTDFFGEPSEARNAVSLVDISEVAIFADATLLNGFSLLPLPAGTRRSELGHGAEATAVPAHGPSHGSSAKKVNFTGSSVKTSAPLVPPASAKLLSAVALDVGIHDDDPAVPRAEQQKKQAKTPAVPRLVIVKQPVASVKPRALRGCSEVGPSGWRSEEDRRLFNETWEPLKRIMGWSIKWSVGKTEELYVPRGCSIDDSRLEGVHYFTHRDAFVRHLKRNPCIYMSWASLRPMLIAAGWTMTGNGESWSFSFAPAVQRGVAERGLHVFSSYLAVLRFLQRFPFILQSDELFAEALLEQGWLKSGTQNNSWREQSEVGGRSRHSGYSLSEVRTEMWVNPAKYLRGISCSRPDAPPLTDEELRESVRLAEEDNEPLLDDELESDSVTESPARDSSQTAKKTSQNGRKPKALAALKLMLAELSQGAELDEARFRAVLGGLKWTWTTADCFASEWWRHEFIICAPWFNFERPRAGLDYFFDIQDVRAYLEEGGHNSNRNRQPIALGKDLTAPHYNINKRIQEIAYEAAPFSHNLDAMLRETGWELRKLKRKDLQLGIADSIYVPHWTRGSFDEDLLSSMAAGEDYFLSRDDAVTYLREHGNMKKCDSDSTSAATSSADKYPESPQRQLEYLIRHEDLANMWMVLRDHFDWSHVNCGKRYRESSIYLAPWASDKYENGGRSDPDVMTLNKDYFYGTVEIAHYLSKHGNVELNRDPTPEALGVRHRKTKVDPVEAEVPVAKKASSVPNLAAAAVNKSKSSRPKPPTKPIAVSSSRKRKIVNVSVLDKHCRALARDLLGALAADPNCDLRKAKYIVPICNKHGMHWFFGRTNGGVDARIFTFLDKNQLCSSKRIKEYAEGVDYWVDEEGFIGYVLGQLALLGYDPTSNSADPSIEVESDDELDPAADVDYTLLPPLQPLQPRRLSVDVEEIANHYMLTEQAQSQPVSPAASSIDCAASRVSSASESSTSRKHKAEPPLSSNSRPKKARGDTLEHSNAPVDVPVESQPSRQHPQLSLSDRVEAAKTALLPGCREFAVIGRDKEFNIILQGLRTAISEECGLGLYLCGMSGGGKTATVEKVFQALESEEQTHKVVRVCGADLKEPFAWFAERFNWRDGLPGWCEQTAERVCMRHFVPSPTKSSGRTSAKRVEEPTVFVLFIDEIDKLPRSSVRKLYEIAKAPASRLVVVGIANHVRFRDEIDLEKEDLPELIVFPPLPKSSLKEIIASRTFGLIGDRAADMLVMKVGLKCSDVRLLLDLAAGSIDVAMRRPENAERAFEVGDFAVAEHPDVAKHFQAVGLGPNKMSNDIRDLPGPVRSLLVSLALDRLGKSSRGMRLPEMQQAANTYMSQLNWPLYSREDTRKALECLQTYGLVRGGPNQFVRRLDADEYMYEVLPTIEEIIRADRLEAKHKSSLEKAKAQMSQNIAN